MKVLAVSLLLSIALVPTPAQAEDAPRVARCEVTDNPRPFTRPGATRIAITDFDLSGRGATPEDGARIADLLCRALDTFVEVELKKAQIFIPPAELEIVRVPRPIRAFSDGRALGQDLRADVVLWGDGSCEIPTGELVLKASDEASRAVAGAVRARGYGKVTIEADGGATAIGGDLDVEALNLYSVCTRAALVSWDLFGASESTDNLSMNELRNLPLGSFTVGDPQAVLDLVLALHFVYRSEPLQADHFLPSVRGALADRPDLMDLGLLVASVDWNLGRMEDVNRQLEQILLTSRAMGEQGLEGTALNNIGMVYAALGDPTRALEHYEQAILLHRGIGDRAGEATTLNNIGGVYASLGDYMRALEYFERSLPLRRAVNDRSGEATTLSNIGGVYHSLGDHNRALEHHEQALLVFRAIGDRFGEGTTLNNLGSVYAALGDPKRALKSYERALVLKRATGHRVGEATTLTNIGKVYSELGDQKRALENHEQALVLVRAVGHRAMEATTLNNIGGVYSALGDWNRALEYYEQALLLLQAVGDRAGEGRALNNLGGVCSMLGDPTCALKYYEQALLLQRAAGDRSGEGSTLSNIGVAYYDLGDWPRALEYFERSLPLLRAVGDRSGEATTLNNIGMFYTALGDQRRALEYFEQALPLFRAVGNRPGEGGTLNNIGVAYAALGDHKRALEYYEQALSLRRAIGDRAGEAMTLGSIAGVYYALGDLPRALEYFEQALPIFRSVGDRLSEARALGNIGKFYSVLGEPKRALKYYEQSLPLLRAVGDLSGLIVTLSSMAEVEVEIGRVPAGMAHLQEATETACSNQHPDCLVAAGRWYGLAKKHDRQDQVRAAQELLLKYSGDDVPPAERAAERRRAQPEELGGRGVLITKVLLSSNASRSNLQVGDIIVRYNGEPVNDVPVFGMLVRATAGGDEPIPVVLIRGDEVIHQNVEPGLLGVYNEAVP